MDLKFTSQKEIWNNEAPYGNDRINDTRIFSGTDIVAYVSLPGKKTHILGTLTMCSVSTHRDKFPVTSLGRTKVKGFTAGVRIIGGTLVFATFDRSVWHKMIDSSKSAILDSSRIGYKKTIETMLADDIPLFDITVSMTNEYGNSSYFSLLGVTILDEGFTYSIDNIQLMESYSYMAIDMLPFQPTSGASDLKAFEKFDVPKSLIDEELG